MFTKVPNFVLTLYAPKHSSSLIDPLINGYLWAWMETATVQAGMVGFTDGMEHVHIEKYSYGGNVSQWLMKARQLLWVIESRMGVWDGRALRNLVPECGQRTFGSSWYAK